MADVALTPEAIDGDERSPPTVRRTRTAPPPRPRRVRQGAETEGGPS
jgi:hypothetical protein